MSEAYLYNKIYNLPKQIEHARRLYLQRIREAREYACPELLTDRDLMNEMFENEVGESKRAAA